VLHEYTSACVHELTFRPDAENQDYLSQIDNPHTGLSRTNSFAAAALSQQIGYSTVGTWGRLSRRLINDYPEMIFRRYGNHSAEIEFASACDTEK